MTLTLIPTRRPGGAETRKTRITQKSPKGFTPVYCDNKHWLGDADGGYRFYCRKCKRYFIGRTNK